MNDNLSAAIGYAVAGLAVFPIVAGTKRPATQRGWKDASCLVTDIFAWWEEHPDYGIGLPVPPGMVVIDPDKQHGGDIAFRKLVDQHGPLPETWCAQTGNGGWHLWFATDCTRFPDKLCEGVDFRSGGKHYVVAPPTIHPNGRRYQWIRPPSARPARLPAWVTDIAHKPDFRPYGPPRPPAAGGHNPTYVNAIVERELAKLAAATSGHRNNTLSDVSHRLFELAKGGHVDPAAAKNEMERIASAIGLQHSEIHCTLRSAWRRTQPKHPPASVEIAPAFTIEEPQ